MNYKVYFFWITLIILWNFGFPNATPIWDVIIAIVLSMVNTLLIRKADEKI